MRAIIGITGLAVVGLTGSAIANPGDLLWSYGKVMNCTGSPLAVQGRVYWNGKMGAMGCFAGVSALTASGQLLWETPPGVGDNGTMSVGADGAIYANSITVSGTDLIRINPADGSVVWAVPIPQSYGTLFGPDVGPDGNIYGVTKRPYAPGCLYSFTPDGWYRWHVMGFYDSATDGLHLGFAENQVVVVADTLPLETGPFGSSAGAIAFSFDGVEVWHDNFSIVQSSWPVNCKQPTVSPTTGWIHIANRGSGGPQLGTYNTDGEVEWQAPVGGGSPVVDPQGNLYFAVGSQHLVSLDAQGVQRWARHNVIAGQSGLWGIAISDDGRFLAATIGACYGGACPGRVYVFRTSDGSTVFDKALPNQASGVSWGAGIPDFSPDGSIVYVAARMLPVYGNGEPDQQMSYLYAYEVEAPACSTGDFNGDGDFGTDADIEAFFACLAGSCCSTCWRLGADFDGDGDVGTDGDIESFFRVLAGGGC